MAAADGGARTIPFARSYLPGRSRFHIVFAIVVAVVIPVVIMAAEVERDALEGAASYGGMIGVLVVLWLLARWSNRRFAGPDNTPADFDIEPADRLITLDLWDNRFLTGPVRKDLRAPPPA